jgi:small subunit ribosomal protein S2
VKLILGKLADAIYEGRHGQLEDSDESVYEEFDGGDEEFVDEAEGEENQEEG